MTKRIGALEGANIKGLGEKIVTTPRTFVERKLAPLEARLAAWRPGRYERGALVQRSNALWICLADTSDAGDMPGASPHWRKLT